ncbi:hypothetical protein P3S67_031773 [Capsicum chacoense]
MSTTKNNEQNIRILLEAAKSNHVKPFLIALKRDININESYDWEGVHRTPFMVVCMYGGENVIRLLLDTNKVFVVFKSSDGKTPLEFARESRIPDDLIKLCGRHWKIYNFKIKSCPNRSCLKGRSSCPYLHINEPARRDPAFVHYSPSLCKNFTKGHCREALKCTLAHGWMERNYHPDVFRMQRCFRGERCNRIDTCPHAHYVEEKLPRYRPAAVLTKPPQTQQSPWLPIQ